MPSSLHPQAKFDPLPPDLDLNALVEKTPNFDYVIRISVDQLSSAAEFEHLVLIHVIIGGRPLVVEEWNKRLPPWLFSSNWLQDNVGKKEELVRDITNGTNIPMTIGHYLSSMEKLTSQWSPTNFRDPKRQRLYLKDINCPEPWHQHLQGFIPQNLFYLNDSVGEKGGPGAVLERNLLGQQVLGKGIAPAGDLMTNLPEEMRAENLMCYIGHEGTYTPAHREMCASLGQNIMVEASKAENGEKPGSSVWFMTESKDRQVVSEYFLSMLGHDIEVENHFAQINAWRKAPFPVYIVEQKVGDFILIPPLAPHQVWNRGTRTMKVAWNRITVETLELALHEALPQARMVCRDEQYKNKAIIYHSLLNYYNLLVRAEQLENDDFGGYSIESIKNAARVKQLQKDFKRLFALYTEILVSEIFSPGLPTEKKVEFIPFDSNITCSYCRCNIFNRFLTCKTCIGDIEGSEDKDTYDVCMECFAMGRSCACISGLKWVEQWEWPALTSHHEQWRAMVVKNDGYLDVDSSPLALEDARIRSGKKTVAQICQEQLKLRPWRDPAKLNDDGFDRVFDSDSPEPEVDDEGRVKKKKSKRKAKPVKHASSCHICFHYEWDWKLAFCTTCSNAYCYGTLWRAFDAQPQTIMEMAEWQCPRCRKICSCGKCRKTPGQVPYRPKGTLLGHDTRKVADARSVESLVDFRKPNLTWLRGEGDDDPQSSQRMQNLLQKAQDEKARDDILEEEIVPIDDIAAQDPPQIEENAHSFIDPLLRGGENGDYSVQDASSHINAHRGTHDNSFHSNKTGQGHSSNGGFAAPVAPMLGSESGLHGTEHGRMMGMGYYEQSNDADRILFDHPDASNPSVQTPYFVYPRLPDEDDNGPRMKKRRLDGFLPINAPDDQAHLQYAQVLRTQRLAQAKRDGTYYMTKHKLDGGRPRIVVLNMRSMGDFQKRLQDMDTGLKSKVVRHNPRPPRPSVHQLSDAEEGPAKIVSDIIVKKPKQSIYLEPSDDEDDEDYETIGKAKSAHLGPKSSTKNRKRVVSETSVGGAKPSGVPKSHENNPDVSKGSGNFGPPSKNVSSVNRFREVDARPDTVFEGNGMDGRSEVEGEVVPGNANIERAPKRNQTKETAEFDNTEINSPASQSIPGRRSKTRLSDKQVRAEVTNSRDTPNKAKDVLVSGSPTMIATSESRKKPGRPPKQRISDGSEIVVSPQIRKPGRPPKATITPAKAHDEVVEKLVRKTVTKEKVPTNIPRPRGRPSKSYVPSSPSMTESSPSATPESLPKVTKPRRSVSFVKTPSDSGSEYSKGPGAVPEDSPVIDKEYQKEKLAALRDLEAEAPKESNNTMRLGLGHLQPPGKMMSLAEKRALMGKTTNIVQNKTPAPPPSGFTPVKSSKPSSTVRSKPIAIIQKSLAVPTTSSSLKKGPVAAPAVPTRAGFPRTYSSDSDSSSDSSGDGAIPAYRPGTFRPAMKPAALRDGIKIGFKR